MNRYLLLVFFVFSTACEGVVDFTDLEGNPIGGTDATLADGVGSSTGAQAPQGVALYQTYCSSCHGATGEGTAIFPTSIQGFEPIADLVLSGRGTMAPMALQPAEVDQIQAFLLSLAAPTETLDGPGLYGRYCASCHGADAGGAPNWPGSIQAYEPIEGIVLNGKGTMDPVPIGVTETAKIQAWLLTLAAPNTELDGQGLYVRYCATCHGADGSGGTEWAGSIQAYEPIQDIVVSGRGTMDSVALDASQIAEVQAFLLTLAPALSTLSGPEVYDRLCLSCHGDRGEGIDTTGMQLRYDDAPFSRYWVRAGRTATGAYDADMPAYPDTMISDQQIDEMFTWIDQAQHPTTGQGLYDQYCANCHGPTAGGGASQHNVRGDGAGSIVRNGNGGTNYGSRTNYMTGWSTQQLSAEEASMIADYTNSL